MSAAVWLAALLVAVAAFAASALLVNYLFWRGVREDRRDRRDRRDDKRRLEHAERMAAHNGRPHTDAVVQRATRRHP